MNPRQIVSILFSKKYSYIVPYLRLCGAKYPQIKLECFESLDEFKQSDHWGKTDALGLLFRSSSDLDESLVNNPLKWVHSFTAGVDAYVTPMMKGSHVPLTNSKGAYNESLTEYTFSIFLHFNKMIHLLENQKENKEYKAFIMPTLYRSTLLVLGYGSIGKSIARMGKNFGMNVLGVKRTVNEQDNVADRIIETSRLHEVLPEADFLAMAMPNHPSAHNIMSAREFSIMKPTSVIVNIGRGNSINEDDLAYALNNDIIAGAGLDVFKVEPLPVESALWTAKNLIISPHNADMVGDLANLSVGCFEGHLNKFLNSQDFDSIVDKHKGY